ncbi:hypothetical protein RHGRI_002361 [Rhododendron griersonianum]|uniref:Uncharacterized protein n=1 Tax=Rhododendron griersonianum TaxID=479676 RepID=A0AAV6LPJ2_9ERIC|nr:hypothetical protein RHGRI_002361 [Rhododendron griersonianum]
MSQSIPNLSTSLSRHCPLPKFLSAATLDAPASLSAALTRLRQNAKYFATKYAVMWIVGKGFFLDEDDVVSSGLIGPPPPPALSSRMKDFAN